MFFCHWGLTEAKHHVNRQCTCNVQNAMGWLYLRKKIQSQLRGRHCCNTIMACDRFHTTVFFWTSLFKYASTWLICKYIYIGSIRAFRSNCRVVVHNVLHQTSCIPGSNTCYKGCNSMRYNVRPVLVATMAESWFSGSKCKSLGIPPKSDCPYNV